MLEENEKIYAKYKIHLHKKYNKINTYRSCRNAAKYFLEFIKKPVGEITEEDTIKWKQHVDETYKQNSRSSMLSRLNMFLEHIGKKDLKLPVPKTIQAHKKTLSEEEFNRYLKASEEEPLWYLIAILQTDGLLRPGEFSKLRISNIDWENRRFYLDDTKTGNNYIILSPLMEQAISKYAPYRNPLPKYKDYLIIIPSGRYEGRPPAPRGTFIKDKTKEIARAAQIKKRVTPYETIKPTTITLDFDHGVNPRITQRKARHKSIIPTLRYDHTDDKKLLEHFQRRDQLKQPQDDSERKRLLTDQYLRGELDLQTFKRSLDILDGRPHEEEGVGYV